MQDHRYTPIQLIEILNAKAVYLKYNEQITEICIDSRRVGQAATSLFFAIRSKTNDGHKYLKNAHALGIRMFVIDDGFFIDETFADSSVFQVNDSVFALQRLAHFHRLRFELPVLAITGSNGKTIVKEWLSQMLALDFKICKSPRSYNSQIGVPLSVWQLKKEHELAIFEAGVSQVGEMLKLETILKPSQGMFLNIGEAHAEGFAGIANKVQEKMQLFKQCSLLFYSLDYPLIHKTAQTIRTNNNTLKTVTWSLKGEPDANLRVLLQTQMERKTRIEARWQKERLELTIPFTDQASIENAVACWCYLLYHGIENKVINQRMQFLQILERRLEVKAGRRFTTIINDSYSLDLKSLEVALSFMMQQKQHKNFTLIISDIPQNETEKEEQYHKLVMLLKRFDLNRLILIGKELKLQKSLFKGWKTHFYESTEAFLRNFKRLEFSNETVLLKGARAFKFELIEKKLISQTHDTVLFIDMDALSANFNVYKSFLKPQVKTMAMVKALAYGSGAFEIANQLQYQGVDYLAVAYVDEGIALRDAGIGLPIMVMSPEANALPLMVANKLEPEIYSIEQIKQMIALMQELNLQILLPIHLKINTGMNRLGIDAVDLPELIKVLKTPGCFEIKSIFSHLAAADEETHQNFTQKQIKVFEQIFKEIISQIGYFPMRHLLNSAGIVAYPNQQFEMVRLGIGLYGIHPIANKGVKLQNVSALKTVVRQVRHVQAGESVGYSRSGLLSKSSTIATIAIGYADGISRACGNGKVKFWVNGGFAPTVGHICMDMCMIDVTGLQVEAGDIVEIFGPNNPIMELAQATNQSPYEWLTAISHRVKRIYTREVF